MSRGRAAIFAAAILWSSLLLVNVRAGRAQLPVGRSQSHGPVAANASMFAVSTECLACHDNLITPAGDDVSIGASWRGSRMANSARDPYLLASVRREILDHSSNEAEIQDECAACHMPAAQKAAKAAGGHGRVFREDGRDRAVPVEAMAGDGVSCTVCHQISSERLGTPQSFNGNFVVAAPLASGRRRAFGAFAPDRGRSRIMHSVTGFEQEQAAHIQQSELCATCHTLVTVARGPDGATIGSLPEQMPYQEWRHSTFEAERRSCQSCHMPRVAGPVRVASVLGEERPSLARHTFLGGNAFMLRLMNRFRDELGIEATSAELEATARATVRQLEEDTATLTIDRAAMAGDTLELDVVVRNLAGHKFPTGYPSRRAWIHVTAMDAQGRTVFESGRVNGNGLIDGNAGDASRSAFEPHYEEITSADQVQIYESIMGTPAGTPTTGLLQATQYLKDNRLLPRGFDKQTAAAEIAVFGGAARDRDFLGEGDRVRYRVTGARAASVHVELRYQPIGYRWAQNLAPYTGAEPQKFVRYYNAVASVSSVAVAQASSPVRP
jgi:mono/diheme cytochrome c family protein